jgi:hypothetical protein
MYMAEILPNVAGVRFWERAKTATPKNVWLVGKIVKRVKRPLWQFLKMRGVSKSGHWSSVRCGSVEVVDHILSARQTIALCLTSQMMQ